ncbi:MAG: hypothetical protein PHU49_01860 [Syntrophorhabdaceae bacterium]|nr:hypothetical protein [Syntrophorhabdaceae bacterium]
MKKILKKSVKKVLGKIGAYSAKSRNLDAKSSPDVKISQRQLFNFYQYAITRGHRFALSDTGFRNYSQFEEDGILLYIFAAVGVPYKTFIDIGSGDGINSNCANLAVNFGWRGLFIDGNPTNIDRGKKYYAGNPDTALYPPTFVQAFIQRENINELIRDNGFAGEVDLMSIDIDGNDYWIWDALTVVEPHVVIIETHIEFGMNSIVVPYDKDYSYPGKHPDYHGASPVAMEKLARGKGYRLVGANNYGFNTIYIKNGIGEDILPAVSVESILQHPRNKERYKLFEPIKDWDYLHV